MLCACRKHLLTVKTDATYKAKVLAERNKSILRDYDNQIDLNFGLMKLCIGEFECELERRY